VTGTGAIKKVLRAARHDGVVWPIKVMEDGKMRTLILVGLLIAPLPAIGQTVELVHPPGDVNCPTSAPLRRI
jgi:hypothetical protein